MAAGNQVSKAFRRAEKIFTAGLVAGAERVAQAMKTIMTEVGKASEPVEKTRNRQRELFRKRNGEMVEIDKRTGGRPADTYHANGGGAKVTRTEHRFDRATWRCLRRQGQRANAGRWPGIGDPNAMESWRRQQRAEAKAR
jgi:hypothetical protein